MGTHVTGHAYTQVTSPCRPFPGKTSHRAHPPPPPTPASARRCSGARAWRVGLSRRPRRRVAASCAHGGAAGARAGTGGRPAAGDPAQAQGDTLRAGKRHHKGTQPAPCSQRPAAGACCGVPCAWRAGLDLWRGAGCAPGAAPAVPPPQTAFCRRFSAPLTAARRVPPRVSHGCCVCCPARRASLQVRARAALARMRLRTRGL